MRLYSDDYDGYFITNVSSCSGLSRARRVG